LQLLVIRQLGAAHPKPPSCLCQALWCRVLRDLDAVAS
jgi:hypothetical protein